MRTTTVECNGCGKKAKLRSIEIIDWIQVLDLFVQTGIIWKAPKAVYDNHLGVSGDFCSTACFEQYIKARGKG